ncbi:MAG: acetylxylan esterase [Planctomycetota bacterium]|nr:acetylxylan esterase [Planctomycetota bacterium]
MKPTTTLLASLLLSASLCAETIVDRKVALGLLDTCAQAPKTSEAEGFQPDGAVHAIFYDALPWKGQPTRVFAWIGLPAKREGKIPGIVLVHGGGGTAYKEWVQKWNAQGFAAISIAVEGQTDVYEKTEAKGRPIWARHAFSGPARDGTFADTKLPLKEQWMYHALPSCQAPSCQEDSPQAPSWACPLREQHPRVHLPPEAVPRESGNLEVLVLGKQQGSAIARHPLGSPAMFWG